MNILRQPRVQMDVNKVCGIKILSDTLPDTGYGNSLQLSRKLITQEFGVPGDSGLWESHSGRVGVSIQDCVVRVERLKIGTVLFRLFRLYTSTVHLSGPPSLYKWRGCA